MLQILHYIPGFAYGGIESLFLEWYQHIDKSEFDFDLLRRVENDSLILEQYKKMGGHVYQLEKLSFRNISGFKRSVKNFFVKEKRYDIIHIHGNDPFIMFYAKKSGGSKIILHSHTVKAEGWGLKTWLNVMNERIDFILWADEGWACSTEAAHWKFGNNKQKSKKIRIIHNSIKWEKYIFNKQIRKCVRKNWSIENKFVIGTVGRITQAKNPKGILEIFSLVKEKIENACLLWVGDGINSSHVKEEIEALNLNYSVIITGYRDDVSDLLQAMDVFVLPSLWEGLPLVALEAQASGLPTLCSENVTVEVDVTPLCKHIPLADLNVWAEEICSIADFENDKRCDSSKYFKNSVYDVENGIKELQAGYKALLEK